MSEPRYEASVRIKLAPSGVSPCVTVTGKQVLLERGSFSHAFGVAGRVFVERAEVLLAQEEIFTVARSRSLEVLLSGGTVSLVAIGGPGSGKSHTLFGTVPRTASPPRRSRPATPRDGLRAEGLLPRFAAHLLPCTLSFTQFSSQVSKCLLTGGVQPVEYPVTDVSTMCRLISRALSTATAGATLAARVSANSGGTLLVTELGMADMQALAPAVAAAAEGGGGGNGLYSLEEAIAQSPISANLSALLLQSNDGLCIACIDAADYTTSTATLRSLEKWKKVRLWPIPPPPSHRNGTPSGSPPPRPQLTPSSSTILVPAASPQRSVSPSSSSDMVLTLEGLVNRVVPKGDDVIARENCLLGVIKGLEGKLEVEHGRRLEGVAEMERVQAALRRTELEVASLAAVREEVRNAEEANHDLRINAERATGRAALLEKRLLDAAQNTEYITSCHSQAEAELVKIERRARAGSEVKGNVLQENHDLHTKCAQSARELSDAKEDNEALRTEANTLRSRLETAEGKNLDLSAEKTQLDLQLLQAKEAVVAVQRECTLLQAAPAQYEEELQRAAREERAGRALAVKAAKDKKTLQGAIAALKEELDRQAQEHQRYKSAAVSQMRIREAELVKERDHIDRAELDLAEKAASLTKKNEGLQKQLDVKVQEVLRLKGQMKEIKAAANETIDALNESLDRTCGQLQSEVDEVARLKQMVWFFTFGVG